MYYAPVKIPGYEDLVTNKKRLGRPKELKCPKCPDGIRPRLKSGKYDPYCKKCRSEANKKYRIKRGQTGTRKKRNMILWGTREGRV